MLRCHLARVLGEKKLKITDVSRDTGINRGTLTRMYHETAKSHDVAVLDVLCSYLGCEIAALLEHVPEEPGAPLKRLGPRRSA